MNQKNVETELIKQVIEIIVLQYILITQLFYSFIHFFN